MSIGQHDLMRMNFAGKRIPRKGDRFWTVIGFIFNLWQLAVVALCLWIAVFG